MRIQTTLLLLLVAFSMNAQYYSPADAQKDVITITGGTAHLGNGTVLENATIIMERGKIKSINDKGQIPPDSKVIDAKGKHIYPGFIAANSILGITEIARVRASRDYREVGGLNPHVRSIIAFNTDSRIIPTVRSNGVLISQVTPRGGTISGTSSVVELDAWNWEDALVREDDGIHMNWPMIRVPRGWWGEPKPEEANKRYHEQVDKLIAYFDEAQAYARSGKHTPMNRRFEAMKGLFDKSKTLFIYSNKVKEMVEAVNFAKSYGMHVVLVSARDSWKIADWLAEEKVPVILYRVHNLPARTDDDIDQAFKTPAVLKDAGVLFCLGYEGGMEAEGVRNLPFAAGTAAAYGLGKEEALRAITLNTATILGIQDRAGSLEAGKDATLFISTGDALDMLGNKVERAFIQGRDIQVPNHQDRLYQKYTKKYGVEE